MLSCKSIPGIVICLGLTACSVGPRYKRPTLVLPQQFTNAQTVDDGPHADASDPEFGIAS